MNQTVTPGAGRKAFHETVPAELHQNISSSSLASYLHWRSLEHVRRCTAGRCAVSIGLPCAAEEGTRWVFRPASNLVTAVATKFALEIMASCGVRFCSNADTETPDARRTITVHICCYYSRSCASCTSFCVTRCRCPMLIRNYCRRSIRCSESISWSCVLCLITRAAARADALR